MKHLHAEASRPERTKMPDLPLRDARTASNDWLRPLKPVTVALVILVAQTLAEAADLSIGRYSVNYRFNAAGYYTDQSHPDYTKANPYYGTFIAPGPIFIDATPGQYRLVVDAGGGCGVWSGDRTGGSFMVTGHQPGEAVTLNHTFGQIALYYWDWYPWDNDPSIGATISVYRIVPEPGDSYEPDNSSGEAKMISNGETQNRSIHLAGNEDWARFTITAASDVRLRTGALSGFAGGDTVMWLYGPNSATTQVAYNDDANGSLWSDIRVTSLAPGTYYVRIQEYGNNGTIAGYTLSLTATPAVNPGDSYEPDNSSGEAKPISNGETQNRSIHLAGNEDWARFTITAASEVRLRTGALSGFAGGDTVMWLYGPNSATTQVAYNDDANGSLWSDIRVANLAPGTYYVRIQEYGNNGTIAAYTLQFTATPTPILIGRFEVNYRFNAAGCYTDQSNPQYTDYTKANPYYGTAIAPGPIFLNATPGQYRLVLEAGTGCGVWTGDRTSGSFSVTGHYPGEAVTLNHAFGQIVLYYWDWYPWDNDPSLGTTVSVYQITSNP